jgi:hypothetical protein
MRPILSVLLLGLALVLGVRLPAQGFTRGVGVYPGDPGEDFAPALRPETSSYRNLALRRPVFQSSAYDYNLTGQLVTDGIRDATPPAFLAVAAAGHGTLRKQRREWIFDGNLATGIDLPAPGAWVQFMLGGEAAAPEVDRVTFHAWVRSEDWTPKDWTCVVSGCDDGSSWRQLGLCAGVARGGGGGGGEVQASVDFACARCRHYRLDFDAAGARSWFLAEVSLGRQGRKVPVGGPYAFHNAWKSAGSGQEWLYVDLGAPCAIDRVALRWIQRPAQGAIQVSGDAAAWKTVRELPATGADDDLRFGKVQARYVRVLMTRPVCPDGYVLGQLEVYGKGGPMPQARPAPAPAADGSLELAGGAWRVQRGSQVRAGGGALSLPGFDDGDWVPATVPGTTLASYLNAGALADPNYADNQLLVSDSFFYADFWYRDEFLAPGLAKGRMAWLDFDGINWKAEVFLNGRSLGRIEGGFTRKRFDVTGLLRPGQINALAVRVEKNATPGSVKEKSYDYPDRNGGALGSDNPTCHASVGWDWIPTIRGRNTGIWGKVRLSQTGAVTLSDPSVATTLPLPATTSADVALSVKLQNHGAVPVTGTLQGSFGEVTFAQTVTLAAGAQLTFKADPATVPGLRLSSPRLWWPVGYGSPERYPVDLRFVAGGTLSDRRTFQAGIRQIDTSQADGALRLWVNGRRFIAKGGNWGISESMLRYRAREYDAAVRYHRDMHFNMIRNWVGQTGDDAFYDACDKYGVLVWQDFWLANPWDGDGPDSAELFLANATDTVLRIRTHPALALYCGRNEGFPPSRIDSALRAILAGNHPGVPYLPSSADDLVEGRGPYQVTAPEQYFSMPFLKLHSEMGLPNSVSLDSLKLFLPADRMWPQDSLWGLHDFCLGGALGGPAGGPSFNETLRLRYGAATSAAEWLQLAQFLNYDGYRAMFEAQGARRMGLLIWMSHPSWPSFVWQTYDYYLEPTAGYFGAKKACEPLHIQHNPGTGRVEVVNASAGDQKGLTATAQLLSMDGTVVWEQSRAVDLPEDSIREVIPIQRPVGLSPLYFIRLKLTRGQELLSETFYWKGLEEDDTRRIRDLAKVHLEVATETVRQGEHWTLTTTLRNASATPALQVRIKPVREHSGDRILPALMSDNYIALMPQETRTLVTEVEHADTRGERPRILVEGINVGLVSALP